MHKLTTNKSSYRGFFLNLFFYATHTHAHNNLQPNTFTWWEYIWRLFCLFIMPHSTVRWYYTASHVDHYSHFTRPNKLGQPHVIVHLICGTQIQNIRGSHIKIKLHRNINVSIQKICQNVWPYKKYFPNEVPFELENNIKTEIVRSFSSPMPILISHIFFHINGCGW